MLWYVIWHVKYFNKHWNLTPHLPLCNIFFCLAHHNIHTCVCLCVHEYEFKIEHLFINSQEKTFSKWLLYVKWAFPHNIVTTSSHSPPGAHVWTSPQSTISTVSATGHSLASTMHLSFDYSQPLILFCKTAHAWYKPLIHDTQTLTAHSFHHTHTRKHKAKQHAAMIPTLPLLLPTTGHTVYIFDLVSCFPHKHSLSSSTKWLQTIPPIFFSEQAYQICRMKDEPLPP